MRRRFTLAGVCALAIGLGTIGDLAPMRTPATATGPIPASPPIGAAAAAPAPVSGSASMPAGMAGLDERVAFWEARVANDATDYSSTIALIDAYLERARLTGDLGDVERAGTAIERAERIAPTSDPRLPLRRGQAAMSLHDFTTARAAAEEALRRDPGNEAAVALLGDAALELGDDETARDAYGQLETEGATAPVLSRLARYDLLTDEVAAAEARLRAAIDAALVDGLPQSVAAQRTQLAELLRGENRVEEAAEQYELAVEAVPAYAPALGGLARVREAQGRRDEAIELLERATDRLPTPALVADLGDLHALAGDAAAARDAYALVERIAEVSRAAGSVHDRQLVLFLADHERSIGEAVELATAEIEARRDVFGYDALAWALYRAGRFADADAAAAEALRLGTPDGRILYHGGMIAAAVGRHGDALELLGRAAMHSAALPPLQVPVLEAALAAARERDGG